MMRLQHRKPEGVLGCRTNRRRLLGGGMLGAAALGGALGCSPESPEKAAVRLTWWGGDQRAENTRAMVKLFTDQNPDVEVQTEPVGGANYWEKLAVETAGGSAADVIAMSISFVREYADRGALLDLTELGVDTAGIVPGVIESGQVDGRLYALPTGINAPAILANPSVFDKANVELPDDKSWTWDDYRETAAAITKGSPDGAVGSSCLWMGPDTMLNAWLRQHGKLGIFDDQGITFDVDDIVPWYELLLSYQEAGAIPSASAIIEDEAAPPEQRMFATGRMGMELTYTNVIAARDKATGEDLVILRPPSVNGPTADKQAWYTAAMQWSIAADSQHQEAAAELLNFLLHDVEGGLIQLTDRGIPAFQQVREAVVQEVSESDRKGIEFINAIEPELGPPTPIPVPGASGIAAIHTRHSESVLLGDATPEEAASALVKELNDGIDRAR